MRVLVIYVQEPRRKARAFRTKRILYALEKERDPFGHKNEVEVLYLRDRKRRRRPDAALLKKLGARYSEDGQLVFDEGRPQPDAVIVRGGIFHQGQTVESRWRILDDFEKAKGHVCVYNRPQALSAVKDKLQATEKLRRHPRFRARVEPTYLLSDLIEEKGGDLQAVFNHFGPNGFIVKPRSLLGGEGVEEIRTVEQLAARLRRDAKRAKDERDLLAMPLVKIKPTSPVRLLAEKIKEESAQLARRPPEGKIPPLTHSRLHKLLRRIEQFLPEEARVPQRYLKRLRQHVKVLAETKDTDLLRREARLLANLAQLLIDCTPAVTNWDMRIWSIAAPDENNSHAKGYVMFRFGGGGGITSNLAGGGVGLPIEVDLLPARYRKAVREAQQLTHEMRDYFGLFYTGADFLLTEDFKLRVLETNGNPGFKIHLLFKKQMGVSIARDFVRSALAHAALRHPLREIEAVRRERLAAARRGAKQSCAERAAVASATRDSLVPQ